MLKSLPIRLLAYFMCTLFGGMSTLFNFAKADHFTSHLCRERNYRMDWKKIRKPCERKLRFSSLLYSKKRTNAAMSIVASKDIRPEGEYSSFTIKTFDNTFSPKTIGGDTWRVFIKGQSSLEPLVYDLNNGTYEVSFLLLEAGRYNVTAYLQGTQCSNYVDPPRDWFKNGDYNGHFQSEWQYKRYKGWPYLIQEHMWTAMKTFEFTIVKGYTFDINRNMERLQNWQNICNNTRCNFVFDGFGHWVNEIWKPDVNKPLTSNKHQKTKVRQQRGTLWIYGDCYAYHLYQQIWNKSLCRNQFEKCRNTYNWVYPRWDPDSKKDKSIHWQRHFNIDIPWLVSYFKSVLESSDMRKKDSAMLLNLGLHFIRSTSFDDYRKIINSYIGQIKKHKINVIWRTTTSIYIPEFKAHKRFQTYQRALLFNAYSMYAMCNAGIPIVDVFPMTASYPYPPEDGIHFDLKLLIPVVQSLMSYFYYL